MHAELLKEEGAADSVVPAGLELYLIVFTEEITNCVDVQFVYFISIEQFLEFDLLGNYCFDRNAHHSHIRRFVIITERLQQFSVLNVSAEAKLDISSVFL